MKEYELNSCSIESLVAVKCNACGKYIKKNSYGYFDSFITIEKTWEYGSEFDGDTHSIDICEYCYTKLIESFIINPCSSFSEDIFHFHE